jgi:hypothetical protein
MFTTRFWRSTAVVLCALLLQSCQSHSVSGIDPDEEKGLAVVGPSSASSMHQRTLSEPVAVQPLALFSTSLAAHVSLSRFSKISAHEQDRSTAPSSRLLGPSTLSTLATMGNFPKAPYNLPAAVRSKNSHAMPLGKRLGHSSSPDSPGVCVSKVEEVLGEVPGDAERDSKPPAKRRPINLSDELSKRSRQVCAEESREHGCVRRNVLTVLLAMAGVEPNKAVQLLNLLLVAVQDNACRQQALEALGKVTQASSSMFSECLLSLRAVAEAGDKAVRLLALKTLGEVEWKHYFGEVESAPDLPSDMTTILDSTCPFWPNRKVRDTHLLVLIPATVDAAPFTLNLLEELSQHPNNGGRKTRYRYYDSDVQQQVGAASPAASYWLLMTRNVLPESRHKRYMNQKKLVDDHARRTGLNYEVPKVLEAATMILMHHVRNGARLYSNGPLAYTHCQELIRWRSGEYPSVVGGFGSSGLGVGRSNTFDYISFYYGGVAGCRKFF